MNYGERVLTQKMGLEEPQCGGGGGGNRDHHGCDHKREPRAHL